MNTEQNILKSRLIQLLEMFVGRMGQSQHQDVQNLADSLLQVIYEGKGNDMGIIQLDIAKGLEPFMNSLIDELKTDASNPAQLTVDHVRRVQELLLKFNVKPSEDEQILLASIASMENMLDAENVDVNDVSAIR